jgi:hypothetical protein
VHRRSLAILAATALALGVPAGAHAAAPLENVHYDLTRTDRFDDCGFTIDSVVTAYGHFMIQEAKGSRGTSLVIHDNYHYREVLTNPSTGAWFVYRGHGLFKDLKAHQLEGTLWEYTAHDVGMPVVVEDSQGNTVLRDRGRVTLRGVFDIAGSGQPEGELIESEITGVSGPHPSLGIDFCALATQLIGSG